MRYINPEQIGFSIKNIMYLSKTNVQKIQALPGLSVPDATVFSLPEKVLQFGTGVLLRALPDFIIDSANKKGFLTGVLLW